MNIKRTDKYENDTAFLQIDTHLKFYLLDREIQPVSS